MKHTGPRRSRDFTISKFFQRKTKLSAAVFVALYGLPPDGIAQQVNSATELEEVIVTATRRSETLESVPYSISVISGQQIALANVTDIASLTEDVPGLSTYNYGARFIAATAPNIRGINATGTPRGFRTFEQDPVGTYIGNSPIDGYYQLDDIKQVEVLRGPQGTLYGAGALGGAIRIIPNSPELNVFSGSIEVGGGKVYNSSDPSGAAVGVINIPIGDTLAFRASGRYAYDPGFVDVFGLLKRTNNGLFGVPLLADPSDPVNSSPIYSSRDDWNWQRATTARASVLWKPGAAFSAELADLYSTVSGDGGPSVNFDYPGGVSPFDPHTTLPPGGHYQDFSQIDQPFSRNTNLESLDLSYDSGFATLSATSSYHTTSGVTLSDQTYNIAGQSGGFYQPYYAGVPTNPRFVYDFSFADSEHTFTQEVRLVSKERVAGVFDYVFGLFYENQYRNGVWNVANPGSPERSVAQGCTGPVSYGSSFPNCLLTSGVNDLTFIQDDTQNFEDKSVFGELTWHFMPNGQVTAGARHFSQQFTDAQLYLDFTFPTLVPATPHNSPASKTVGKINPSYEYATDHFVYALWSQGFRRGGANSVPYAGIFEESPLLRYYQPDSTNNYEVGIKGRFSNGLTYTFSVFDIIWDKPQISASLPSGNLAVYNANTAASKGFEASSSGPIGPIDTTAWSYTISFSYVDAELTSDYSLAANNGLGVITPGEIVGKSGTQLPGSPRDSVSATVSYAHNFAANYNLLLSLNGSYHSLITFDMAPTPGFASEIRKSSSYEMLNFYAIVKHQAWNVTGYVTNLTNRQNILVPPSQPDQVGGLTNDYIVSRPREVGLRLGYQF
jgi:iron complex outermembrane recepter protein